MSAPQPIEPGCPWYELSLWGLPDVDWCEAPGCSFVVEPANTWSNLSYLVVAFVLRRWSKQIDHSSSLRWFAPSALLLGLFSFVYHASQTFVLQVLDFAGMFLFLGLALAINLRRLKLAPVALTWSSVVALGMVSVFVLRWLGTNIQPIVAVLVLAIAASEVACRGVDEKRYAWFVAALTLLGMAGIFSLLDVTRTWCNPDNHLVQGHALWHLFSAASMLPLFRFYETIRR